jgi:hypothetical protein
MGDAGQSLIFMFIYYQIISRKARKKRQKNKKSLTLIHAGKLTAVPLKLRAVVLLDGAVLSSLKRATKGSNCGVEILACQIVMAGSSGLVCFHNQMMTE